MVREEPGCTCFFARSPTELRNTPNLQGLLASITCSHPIFSYGGPVDEPHLDHAVANRFNNAAAAQRGATREMSLTRLFLCYAALEPITP